MSEKSIVNDGVPTSSKKSQRSGTVSSIKVPHKVTPEQKQSKSLTPEEKVNRPAQESLIDEEEL